VPDLSRIRAVVFDLFHTLVSIEVAKPPGRAPSDILGIDREAWNRLWFSDPDDVVLGLADFRMSFARVARSLNPEITEAQLDEALAARHVRFRHTLKEVEAETLSGLGRLRSAGLRLGLVSNCSADEIVFWPESPLARLLDAAVFSCEVKLKKPGPRIFRLACDRLGVAPGQSLFVGNGGSDELAGARRAGMTPVLLTRHIELMKPESIPEHAAKAEFSVRTVSELAALLTRHD